MRVNINKSNYLGVKRGNLKLISGFYCPPLHLIILLIRVKRRRVWIKKTKEKEQEREKRNELREIERENAA